MDLWQNYQTTLLSLFFAILSLSCFFVAFKNPESALRPVSGRFMILGTGIFILLFASRFALSGIVTQLSSDTQTFKAWALGVCTLGVGGIYQSGMMVDYPPVYLHILGLVGCFTKVAKIAFDGTLFVMLLSAIPTVCDAMLAYFTTRVLNFANAVSCWNHRSVFVFFGVFILPHAVTNSTLFGQMDSVPYLILSAAFYLLVPKGRNGILALCLSAALFAIALLTKPIVLLFAPLGLLYAWLFWRIKSILVAAVCFGMTAFGILFCSANFEWPLLVKIIEQYQKTLGSYPYASLNAANLYTLLGWNWAGIQNSAVGKISIAQLAKALVILSVVAGSAVAFWDAKKKHDFASRLESVFYCAGLYLTLIFTFADQMHERYLFGAATFFAIACVAKQTKLNMIVAIGVVLLVTLNQSFFLDFHRINRGYQVPTNQTWLVVLSFLQLLTTASAMVMRIKEIKYETT